MNLKELVDKVLKGLQSQEMIEEDTSSFKYYYDL